jgi:hypothetical protein
MKISTLLVTHITTTRLNMSITDWSQYKTVVRDKLTTKMKLKSHEDFEVATSELIDILQHAVKTATPVKNRPRQVKYLPSHIKELVAQKRKARARWLKTDTPEDRRHFNNANNKLRGALHKLNNDTFTAYIASLRCKDQNILNRTNLERHLGPPSTDPCKHKPSKTLG